jgi:hypothetical protein
MLVDLKPRLGRQAPEAHGVHLLDLMLRAASAGSSSFNSGSGDVYFRFFSSFAVLVLVQYFQGILLPSM